MFNAKVNDKIDELKPPTEPKFVVDGKLSIADLLNWDQLLQSNSKSDYFNFIDKIPELKEARLKVQETLKMVPKIDFYKFHVIEKIQELTKSEPMDILKVSLVPKSKEQGDFALPVAALRLPGNPIEWVKTLATEVS